MTVSNAVIPKHFWMSCIDQASSAKESLEILRESIPDLSRVDEHESQLLVEKLLALFVQENFTGPPCDENDWICALNLNLGDFVLDTAVIDEFIKSLDYAAVEILAVDICQEDVLPLVKNASCLLISKWILDVIYANCKPLALLRCKCLFLIQRICEFPSEKVLMEIENGLSEYHKMKKESDKQESIDASILEALIWQYYHQSQQSIDALSNAEAQTGLKWKVTGKLGKRTKYQKFEVSQLTVEVESATLNESPDSQNNQGVPKSLALNDDTLLEQIEFSSPHSEKPSNLSSIDQCILLGHCLDFKSKGPSGDELAVEQMRPFIDFIIEQPQNFSIHTLALYIRSKLDKTKRRKIERGIMQLQALVDQFTITNKEEGGADFNVRYQYFWQLMYPMKTEMEAELGKVFLEFGMVRSALEIFTRLQRWEEVIHCNIIMDEFEKAEKCILEQLEKPDSPKAKLYCILGDLKNDPELYWKAWEVSNYRNARSMRSLGSYYFKEQQLDKCLSCYEKSLAINALFENSWFTYGCAAMQLEEWEKAQNAFTKCVQLEQSNGEAWNNLAAINIRLNRKPDAFRCLKEGLKEKYESWKMWENLFFLSLDLRKFSDGINALDRLLDLEWRKKNAVDIEAIKALVHGCLSENSELLRKNVETVLKRACEMHVALAGLWEILAYYHRNFSNLNEEIKSLQSAFRAVDIGSDVIYDEKEFLDMARIAQSLVNAYVQSNDGYQARLLLRKLLKRAKSCFEDSETFTALQEKLETISSN